MISDEAIEAARPFVESFMKRRGFALRGKEADVLIGYVLEAAAPHLLARVFDEGLAAEFAREKQGRYPTNPYRSQP